MKIELNKVQKIAAIVLLSLSIQGCWGAASIHPIYDEASVVLLDGLLGEWIDSTKQNSGSLVIEKKENTSYLFKFPVADKKLPQKFVVNLVKFYDKYLADFYNDDSISLEGFAIPVHAIYQLDIKKVDNNELKLDFYAINYQLFMDLDDIHKSKIDYITEKGLLLFIAKAPQIQEFFRYLEERNINIFEFEYSFKLKKRRGQSPFGDRA